MPLFVRIPAQDWVDGGWTLDESIKLVNEIKLIGVDVVDIVSGGILQDAWGPNFEGSQVPFSAQIRSATGIKTAVGGAIADPIFAHSVIENEEADAVMIGTAMLRNPHWPLLASELLNGNLVWPNQLLRAKK
jgi:2,4-dienoyl-CoA reductase-like NADH-dependent reductase (Old Yellow Enzyme family)